MMQDSLFLQRLRLVTLENKIAYDELFHKESILYEGIIVVANQLLSALFSSL